MCGHNYLDYLYLEPGKGLEENILVVTDHFTRYTQAYITQTQTAQHHRLEKLAYQEFLKKKPHNTKMFENFEYLKDTNSLVFSQLCIYYYANIIPALVNGVQLEDGQIYIEAVTKTKNGKNYI